MRPPASPTCAEALATTPAVASLRNGALAQLVERCLCKADVRSSILLGSTVLFRTSGEPSTRSPRESLNTPPDSCLAAGGSRAFGLCPNPEGDRQNTTPRCPSGGFCGGFTWQVFADPAIASMAAAPYAYKTSGGSVLVKESVGDLNCEQTNNFSEADGCVRGGGCCRCWCGVGSRASAICSDPTSN